MHARPAASVAIFASGAPTRPHVDVAYLEAARTAFASYNATPELIARLRDQAAQMGCDGLVLGGVTDATDIVNPNFSRKGITATCIVYRYEPIAATPKR